MPFKFKRVQQKSLRDKHLFCFFSWFQCLRYQKLKLHDLKCKIFSYGFTVLLTIPWNETFLVRYFVYLPAQNYTSSISIICITLHTKYSTGKHASFTVSLHRCINPRKTGNWLNTLKYERLKFWPIRMYIDCIIFHFSGKKYQWLELYVSHTGGRATLGET